MSHDTFKRVLKETALLNRYLKSRGINPEFVSKDQKVAHSKTNQFKTWMISHANDPIREGVDKKDTIAFDIPLLIRVLEFAREDLKSDVNLHKMVERLISMRGKGTLTMNQYGKIVKEEFDQLDESSKELLINYLNEETLDETWKYHTYPDNETARKAVKAHHEWRGSDGMASGNPARAMGNNKVAYKGEFKGPKPQKQVSEARMTAAMKLQKAFKREQERSEMSRKRGDELLGKKPEEKKQPVKENLEPMAACNQPGDGANSPDDTVPSKRLSKIKMLLGGKKGQIKEDMYDQEKEDKSTMPVGGKKVKLQKPTKDDVTKEAPHASAILSGGKTLTGEPRDTIEIDPMMKMKKQSPNSQKSV